jgi:hypothetical protein
MGIGEFTSNIHDHSGGNTSVTIGECNFDTWMKVDGIGSG